MNSDVSPHANPDQRAIRLPRRADPESIAAYGPPDSRRVFGATWTRLLAVSAAGLAEIIGWYGGLAPDFFGPLTSGEQLP
jgi:hypothetical protein